MKKRRHEAFDLKFEIDEKFGGNSFQAIIEE